MFEHRSQPLLSRGRFLRRFAWAFAITLGLSVGSIGIGTLGLRFFANMD
jgi:hypothetical protein